MATITAVLVVIGIGIICVIAFIVWKKKKKRKELESESQREVNDHVGYDYAEFTNYDDLSDPEKVSKDNVESTLATVENPYYGREVEIKETGSSIGDKTKRHS